MTVSGIRADVTDAIGSTWMKHQILVVAQAIDTIRVRRDGVNYLITVKEAPSE